MQTRENTNFVGEKLKHRLKEIMKKVFLFCISCIFAIGIQAQTGHLKFMDIPMEGTLDFFSNRLIEEKGFIKSQMGKEDERYDNHQIKLIGKFGGFENAKVYLKQHSKANGISSLTVYFDKSQYDENKIQSWLETYNSLYGDPNHYKSDNSDYETYTWESEDGKIKICIVDDYFYITFDDKTELEAEDKDYKEYMAKRERETVNEICGIPFGSSYETAETKLDNKYGMADFHNRSMIVYYNKTYAGITFNSIMFLFESDGTKSFMNGAVFILDTKTSKEAEEKRDLLYKQLSYKYEMESKDDSNGRKFYYGGYPPANTVLSLESIFQRGFIIEVIKRDKEFTKDATPYFARLMYGRYKYVNEEF